MATFWRLLGFLRPYRRGLWQSLFLACAAMATTVAIPWLTGQAIDAVRTGEKNRLLTLGLIVLGLGVLRLVFTILRRLVAGQVSLGVEVDLRHQLAERLLGLELAFFDQQQTGQLMSRATVDLQAVRFFLGYGLIFITQSALAILLAAAAMMVTNIPLALVALLPAPAVILVAREFGRKSRPALQEVQQRIAELTVDVEESISGVRVVKAFAAEERQLYRFQRSVERVFTQAIYAAKLRAFYTPLIGFLPQLGLIGVLLFGGIKVIDSQLTIGQFTAFYGYVLMLLGPLRMFGVALGMSQRAVASGARIFELLDRAPIIIESENPKPFPQGNGTVSFRNASLTYQQSTIPALDNATFSVPGGTTVALVGPTGSGKTTVVKLIARLYDPSSGSIQIDGIDVRSISLEELRRNIAFVDDAPFLFRATVHDNIAYANKDASREDVVLAAKRAQAHQFISELSEDYETRIGERGLTLSGGQRQRVAIARALLANPRILVLDDATSSIDATTEAEVIQGLREAMHNRTTFLVAHRQSTIALADQIVVFEEGHVAAQGSANEVLKQSSFYREIVSADMQSSQGTSR